MPFDLTPITPGYYNNRGISYYANMEYAQAIVDKSRAIQLDPTNAEYYYRRGNSYHLKKSMRQPLMTKPGPSNWVPTTSNTLNRAPAPIVPWGRISWLRQTRWQPNGSRENSCRIELLLLHAILMATRAPAHQCHASQGIHTITRMPMTKLSIPVASATMIMINVPAIISKDYKVKLFRVVLST